MVRGLDYTENGRAHRFNLNTFSSEINLQGKPNGLTLIEAINQYFEFTEETKYNDKCYFSKKFQAYILPLENHLGAKNFVIIKNGKVFNPNKFVGFSFGKDFLKSPYFLNDLNYMIDNQNWIYFSESNKVLLDFIVEKYNVNPQFEDNFPGHILHLLSCIPAAWSYDNGSAFRVTEPTLEDRTILINLLPDEDFIEFEKEIVILLNEKSIQLLAKHCLTLYSTIQ
jgi:hypothetical protein